MLCAERGQLLSEITEKDYCCESCKEKAEKEYKEEKLALV